ncbi:Uu.00g029950.m01.CDS01 [Anthostomella pinea]|uniref:Uu.00g029950.m01.CDS01 n=1 Tax=Anthostomella pinea TaxID=933095 RepID=A0AAI8V8T3_9PEZI|nr:Uu.00g029950.m01.CDS01 [Anthostomella pinea]
MKANKSPVLALALVTGALGHVAVPRQIVHSSAAQVDGTCKKPACNSDADCQNHSSSEVRGVNGATCGRCENPDEDSSMRWSDDVLQHIYDHRTYVWDGNRTTFVDDKTKADAKGQGFCLGT